jgi:plastocyanin
MPSLQVTILSAVLLAFSASSHATDAEYTIRIKDHKFDPVELRVPAGQKIKLVIRNEDKTAEEFESKSLKREKIVQGGASAIVAIGPLKPGNYPIFGEYHEDSAKGVIIAE